MSWELLAVFLVGMATGKWWSRRKAVMAAFAAGFSEATAVASAHSVSSGNVVYVSSSASGDLPAIAHTAEHHDVLMAEYSRETARELVPGGGPDADDSAFFDGTEHASSAHVDAIERARSYVTRGRFDRAGSAPAGGGNVLRSVVARRTRGGQ